MPKKKSHTTARQLIGWLSEDIVNAGELASRIERSVKNAYSGHVAPKRLFDLDEALDSARNFRR